MIFPLGLCLSCTLLFSGLRVWFSKRWILQIEKVQVDPKCKCWTCRVLTGDVAQAGKGVWALGYSLSLTQQPRTGFGTFTCQGQPLLRGGRTLNNEENVLSLITRGLDVGQILAGLIEQFRNTLQNPVPRIFWDYAYSFIHYLVANLRSFVLYSTKKKSSRDKEKAFLLISLLKSKRNFLSSRTPIYQESHWYKLNHHGPHEHSWFRPLWDQRGLVRPEACSFTTPE